MTWTSHVSQVSGAAVWSPQPQRASVTDSCAGSCVQQQQQIVTLLASEIQSMTTVEYRSTAKMVFAMTQ